MSDEPKFPSDTENSAGSTVRRNPRLAGLRPWKKGQSGNPGGRPRTARLSRALRQALATEGRDGRTLAQMIADAVVGKAKRGNVQAFKEIRDTVEGRPAQALEHRGAIETKTTTSVESVEARLAQLGYSLEIELVEGKPGEDP
jgi:hypothetical protein